MKLFARTGSLASLLWSPRARLSAPTFCSIQGLLEAHAVPIGKAIDAESVKTLLDKQMEICLGTLAQYIERVDAAYLGLSSRSGIIEKACAKVDSHDDSLEEVLSATEVDKLEKSIMLKSLIISACGCVTTIVGELENLC